MDVFVSVYEGGVKTRELGGVGGLLKNATLKTFIYGKFCPKSNFCLKFAEKC